MAGYSGTPLARKLGIKPGHRVGLIGAPADFGDELEPLPDGVRLVRRAGGRFDVVLLFCDRSRVLEGRFAKLADAIYPDGGLWIAWPKKSSGAATDLDFTAVQHHGLAQGLVDNKVCAVDEVWSGLRFVYRREDR